MAGSQQLKGGIPMRLEPERLAELLVRYHELALVSESEVRETLALFEATHPLGEVLMAADSVHVHVRVDDTTRLPRERILSLGGTPEGEQAGYVKFTHAEGLNMIFFNGIPSIAKQLEWEHVPQGGDGQPVYCCHTEVSGKHWLFPRGGGGSRPIEVASGPLRIHGAKMGCDLRPLDPGHPIASKVPACCGADVR
jgi:hypothetical protein